MKQKLSYIITILFCNIFLFGEVYAQDYFIASGDIKKLSLKEVEINSSNTFIYRLKSNDSYTYYNATLNSIMYESKHFYKIPSDLKNSIHELQLLNGNKELNEVIFNNDYILIDEDLTSINIKFKSKDIPISKSETPHTVIIHSNMLASVNKIENGKIISLGDLPYIVTGENFNNEYLFIVPNSKDHSPKEVLLKGSDDFFYKQDVEFKQSPSLKFKRKEFLIENETLNDKEKLIYLDSLSTEIEKEIKKNEKIKSDFFSFFETKLYSYHKKDSMESNEEYEKNQKAYDQYISTMGESILNNSGMSMIQNSYEQKLRLIQNYKNGLNDKINNSKNHILNKVFFVELSANIGKNIPHDASNPGPSMLLGGKGSIVFYHQMTERLNGFARLGGHYSQWYFNERFEDYSSQKTITADYGISFPFKPPFNIKNIVKYVDLNPFISVGYSMLDIINDASFSENEIFFGGGLGLDIRVSSHPVILGAEYSYYTNKFGDLTVLIKVPFWKLK